MKKRLFAVILCLIMLMTLLPTTAMAAKEIYLFTEAEINGVTEPVSGEKPNTDFTVNTNGMIKAKDGKWYNMTNSRWMDGELFEAGKTYKFFAYVEQMIGANKHWPADLSSVKATINGETAKVCDVKNEDYKSVEATFGCPAAEITVTKVDITGVTVPVPGAKPNENFKVSAKGVTKVSGAWYNETDEEWQRSNPFKVGKTYCFIAYLDTEIGYKWSEKDQDVTATLNGKSADFNNVREESLKSVSYKFVCRAEEMAKENSTPTAGKCKHKNTTRSGVLKATCTEKGYTGDLVCSDCGAVLEKGKDVPAPGHDYGEDGICKNCGINKDSETTVTTETETEDISAKPVESKKSSLWWLWVLIAIVVIGGGVAAFFIVKKKKK